MAAVQQTNLFSDDNLQEYNVENSLLEFLEFVLERTVELLEQVACGNDTEINDRSESLLEVLDNTVKMLRSIAGSLLQLHFTLFLSPSINKYGRKLGDQQQLHKVNVE